MKIKKVLFLVIISAICIVLSSCKAKTVTTTTVRTFAPTIPLVVDTTTEEPVITTTEDPTIITTTEDTSFDNYDDLSVNGIYSGSYYDSITTEILDNPELLKSTLNTIINTGYTKRSYNKCWDVLSDVDSYDDYYVECLYTGERIEKDNHGSTYGAWNREHIWAKAYGFGEESYRAYTDCNHLRVAEYSINNNRSDSYFGELESFTNSDEYGNVWISTVFEPRDEVKGDVARMLLYMTVMYDDSTIDLELTDDATLISQSKGKKVKEGDNLAYIGLLSTILKWHYEDPVDSREISRNNKVFTSWQYNRNPFIDHPEYVYYLFKTESLNYIQENELVDLGFYTSYNQDGINYVDNLIKSIGTVSLSSEALINSCFTEYNKLGQVSKSFVKEYHTLVEKKAEFDRLKDLENRNENKSTFFDFTYVKSKSGTMFSNGVNLTYSSASNQKGVGIYAQSSQYITITCTNLYSNIKQLDLYWDTNKGSIECTVTIKDKNGTTLYENATCTVSNSLGHNYIDLSSVTLGDSIILIIKRNATTGNSIRLYKLGFIV